MQSWDTANKGGPQNDWSVCTTWVLARKNAMVLRRRLARARRLPRPQVNGRKSREAVEGTARIGRGCRRRNHAGSGTAGHASPALSRIKPEGDKASRMAVASAKFEAGQAMLPERASWLADLEAELFAFPGGKHDDQCDSISQALLDNNIPWMQMMTPARLARPSGEVENPYAVFIAPALELANDRQTCGSAVFRPNEESLPVTPP